MSHRLPPWLKIRLTPGSGLDQVTSLLSELKLTTVCDGAHCPNRAECFQKKTATFMILGDHCTRNCRFCAVEPFPSLPMAPEPDEPQRVAQAAARLGLKYVVVTSVTRDDLPDGGANHFAQTIREIKRLLPNSAVEVLTPDFKGNIPALHVVLEAGCEVFNHNIETIARLYPDVRPQANYQQSLDVLSAAADWIKANNLVGKRFVKSGLMVGLGESDDEVVNLMKDLKQAQVDIVTIGQYLAPSKEHFPIARFVEPAVFDRWSEIGKEMGFKSVFAGPFVRSSYHAALITEIAGGKNPEESN